MTVFPAEMIRRGSGHEAGPGAARVRGTEEAGKDGMEEGARALGSPAEG